MGNKKALRELEKFKKQAGGQVVWTPKYLNQYRIDVDAGKYGSARPQITDGLVEGLRCRFETHSSAFYAHYFIGKDRKQQVIGYWPEMSIPEAREIVGIIKELAARGVNVQDGLIPRLARELKQHGINWRPDGWVFNPK